MKHDTSFPATLARLREARGWSQAMLARKSGLAQQTVNFLEAGRYTPKLTTLSALAAALGVGPEIFFQKS